MNFLRFLTCMLMYSGLSAQADHISYHRRMTEVSVLILEGKEQDALQRFDSLFDDYRQLPAAHLYLGLQLAGKSGNALGYRYMAPAFLAGVPGWMLRGDSLIARLRLLNPRAWQQAMAPYDSLHREYLRQTHTPLAKSVDSLYVLDQQLTNRLNSATVMAPVYWLRWKRQNTRHVTFLLRLMAASGYPGESQLGISTLDDADSLRIRYGVNCFLSYHKTLFMLVHYFSSRRDDLNDNFLKEVKGGRMSAYEYAVINDFMAAWGKKKYRRYYFNEWHEAPYNDRCYAEDNRHRLGLCTLAQKEAFEKQWKELVKQKREFGSIYLVNL